MKQFIFNIIYILLIFNLSSIGVYSLAPLTQKIPTPISKNSKKQMIKHFNQHIYNLSSAQTINKHEKYYAKILKMFQHLKEKHDINIGPSVIDGKIVPTVNSSNSEFSKDTGYNIMVLEFKYKGETYTIKKFPPPATSKDLENPDFSRKYHSSEYHSDYIKVYNTKCKSIKFSEFMDHVLSNEEIPTSKFNNPICLYKVSRVGGIDGVSREVKNWITMMRTEGVEVHIVTGKDETKNGNNEYNDDFKALFEKTEYGAPSIQIHEIKEADPNSDKMKKIFFDFFGYQEEHKEDFELLKSHVLTENQINVNKKMIAIELIKETIKTLKKADKKELLNLQYEILKKYQKDYKKAEKKLENWNEYFNNRGKLDPKIAKENFIKASEKIEKAFMTILNKFEKEGKYPDFFILENPSLPWFHAPFFKAVSIILKKYDFPAISRSHDFPQEPERADTYGKIREEILEELQSSIIFRPNFVNVSINSKDIEYFADMYRNQYDKNYGQKVPSSFVKEFKKSIHTIYNAIEIEDDPFKDMSDEAIKELKEDFEIPEDNYVCAFHVRAVRRKRPDAAILFLAKIQELIKQYNPKLSDKKKMTLLVTLDHQDAVEADLYFYSKLSSALGIQLIFSENMFNKKPKLRTKYSTAESIAKLCDFSLYTSTFEGFGNNLLELINSGVHVISNTFQVLKEDIIKKLHFNFTEENTISIHQQFKFQDAVDSVDKILSDKTNDKISKIFNFYFDRNGKRYPNIALAKSCEIIADKVMNHSPGMDIKNSFKKDIIKQRRNLETISVYNIKNQLFESIYKAISYRNYGEFCEVKKESGITYAFPGDCYYKLNQSS